MFYSDQDMTIDAKGTATIRHRKDAIYHLPDGPDSKVFAACMGPCIGTPSIFCRLWSYFVAFARHRLRVV